MSDPQSEQSSEYQSETMVNGTDGVCRDIVVIGASAGGIEALNMLLADLPADLPASIFVVVHVAADSPGVLPEILNRAGPLTALPASDGAPLLHGHVYVAPPDHHLLLERDRMRVTNGPKENRARPAVDPLFRSAAYAYGARVIGIVLSGALDDGTAGLWAIKDRGGIAIVQDPGEAHYPSMPRSAQRYVRVDHVLRAAEIARLLPQLVCERANAEGVTAMPESLEIENRIALEDDALRSGVQRLGAPSQYTCPECHGVLIQLKDGPNLRFRCHTGHGFTTSALLAGINQSVDDTLWAAVRTLEERLMLLRHLARHAEEQQDVELTKRLERQALATEDRVQIVRQLLINKHDYSGTSET